MGKKDFGSTAPLGLLCFGMTTALAMMALILALNESDTNLLSDAQLKPLKWAMGGIVQIVAGIIEIYREDLFHGTVFAAYGCFWIAAALGAGCQAYFYAWGTLTCGFTIISLRHSYAGVLLFTGVAIALFLLGGGSSDPPNIHLLKAGGWLGFWMGVLAAYCAFGPIAIDTFGVTLPGLQHIHWPCDSKKEQANVTPFTGSMYIRPKNRAHFGNWSWPWQSNDKDQYIPPAPSNTPMQVGQDSIAFTVDSENTQEIQA